MVTRIAAQFGKRFEELNVRYTEVEAGEEIHSQIIDASKFQRDFGWSPSTGLDEILERTIPFYKQHYATEKAWSEKVTAQVA